MSAPQPESVGTSPAYWTHNVESFPSPVAQFRMAQLIDFDERLYENARIVYRFLVGWYHDQYGDALLSQRHVAKVMKQRAPEGAAVLSNRTVGRAIIALLETGWVARTFKGRGKGKGASRYVPVINVLELAAQGKFPQLGHSGVPVQPGHSSDPLVGQSNGPVDAELGHSIGPKTLPPDPAKEPETGMVDHDFATPVAGLSAAPVAKEGFDELFDVYGVRHDKADARRAYEKLAPDADLHVRMVEAARAWRQSAGSIERMRLRRWIEEERYDEQPKGARKAANDDKPAALASKPAKWVGDVPAVVSPGQHTVFIRDARHTPDVDGNHELTLILDIDNGNLVLSEVPHRFFIEHRDEALQRKGAKHLENICAAAGISDILDVGELIGKHVIADVGVDGSIRYIPDWELEEAA